MKDKINKDKKFLLKYFKDFKNNLVLDTDNN